MSSSEKLMLFFALLLSFYIIFVNYLTLSLASYSLTALGINSKGGLSSLRASSSLDEIISSVVPSVSEKNRPYSWKGVPVTLTANGPSNGYDLLVNMEREISLDELSADKKAVYNKMIMEIFHPCCDAPIGACGCKHAVADRGLIKFLLMKGWSEDKIYDEILLWHRFWWPRHYVIMALYLIDKGADPSSLSSKEWLSSKLSTIRAERIAINGLKNKI